MIKKIHTFNVVVFLAAFLLFQIELIISKLFVPQFGGSYLVWGACVVFFQAVLLAGYVYAHYAVKSLGMWRYRPWHILLYLLPLFVFPGRPLPSLFADSSVPMVLDVFVQLVSSIGLVFFVLSTAAIVIQTWLTASDLPERSHPYALYAVSNLGSFAALLTYPFIFEHFLGLDMQVAIWRTGYFILVCALVFLYAQAGKGRDSAGARDTPPDRAVKARPADIMRWILWSAAGVTAFLSVTNIITYEITPAPLFWVFPLCLYLVSFVLVFKKNPWCPAWISAKFHVVVAFGMLLYFLTLGRIIPMAMQIACYGIPLFLTCMFCQYNLLAHRPHDRRGLTSFYVWIAAGGFIGGILTTWVIPLISLGPVEYFVTYLLVYAALMIDEDPGEPIGYKSVRHVLYLVAALFLWPVVFSGYNIFGLALLTGIFYLAYVQLRERSKAVFISILVVMFLAPLVDTLWTAQRYVHCARNYYGIYKVYEHGGKRFLNNGTTLHGAQFLDPARSMELATYYHPLTPVYQVMKGGAIPYKSVGAIGLGVGTLAAMVGPGTILDFYELDPEVYKIATKYFSFLKQSPGLVSCIIGDARMNLAASPGKQYDLIVVDAFSGDSIPTHLITVDAIAEYRRHLNGAGTILFHVSNRYLDLVPVLFSNARVVGAYACTKVNGKVDSDNFASIWVVFSWDEGVFKKFTGELQWETARKGVPVRRVRPWTDDYSSILSVFRSRHILKDIKEFRPFYW